MPEMICIVVSRALTIGMGVLDLFTPPLKRVIYDQLLSHK